MLYVLILMAAACRLLPHPPNFAPIAALGLFSGAYLTRRTGWLVPLGALLASDAVLGFYSPVLMTFVYAGFAVSGLLGAAFLQKRRSVWSVAGCAAGSATLFFLISNFGCWVAGMYPHGWAGLAQCYAMAVPFYPATLASDLLYSALLFGLYEGARFLAARRVVSSPAS